MLRDLDYKLIERESHRFDTKKNKTWFKYLKECPITYNELFKKYNLHEFTILWYDDDSKECKSCTKNYRKCNNCKIWKDWDGSERQLSFNNWIDVEGPGIWGMTQEKCNERVKKIFEDTIFEDDEFELRTYYYQPPVDKYFNIFYYNRDRDRFDYWFVFKKKADADSRTK